MQTPYEMGFGRTTNGPSAIAKGSLVPGADTFNYPDQVVSATGLTKNQKLMLLASWASDLRTVENKPSLRRLDSGAMVSIDDILEAMTALDGPGLPSGSGIGDKFAPRRTNRLIARFTRRGSAYRTDQDGDPPPSAAAAARPFSPIFTQAFARSA